MGVVPARDHRRHDILSELAQSLPRRGNGSRLTVTSSTTVTPPRRRRHRTFHRPPSRRSMHAGSRNFFRVVPMSLLSWVRIVGDVWLVGTHPEWPDSDLGDPLVVEVEGSRYDISMRKSKRDGVRTPLSVSGRAGRMISSRSRSRRTATSRRITAVPVHTGSSCRTRAPRGRSSGTMSFRSSRT